MKYNLSPLQQYFTRHLCECGRELMSNGKCDCGENERIIMPVLTEEFVARVAHEVNRAYCEGIGDDIHCPWENAPEWQRDSARLGVRFHVINPNANPEDSHNSWLAQKQKDGWKYGPVKDVAKKEHPCCVPFNELPREQQVKDYLFQAVVHALMF